LGVINTPVACHQKTDDASNGCIRSDGGTKDFDGHNARSDRSIGSTRKDGDKTDR